ncbi:glutamyl-tRNA(Gln) amidotransferase [Psychromonas marina]|uniref:Glutamyl-tRNA(Gln) amidotransferase n=1 Tax=Psychromonas marina TaxID=88364 RepID=A0ABQ6E0P3_9GAMM|nr:amidase [Psychromonas marina]GLS90750.1 glutamyl-tRNA(Gln) amidotransferase [Psychromonas marina]
MQEVTVKDASVYCAQGPEHLGATAVGELSGKSFVFKDLFDVKGYVTGAGNPAWLSSHDKAIHSSSLINTLLAHGANCVGRVQTDELAYSLNGQNIHYGTPVNPQAPDCLPGGSSSGSAVAVARGDADFAIGTDTGGSVRVPASYCGLFGLRPTLGKLDLQHCFQLSKSFDTAGVFSRDLKLMGDLFSVLTGSPINPCGAKKLYIDNSLVKQLTGERIAALEQCCKSADITLLRSDIITHSGHTLDSLSLLFRTIQGFEIIELHDQWLQQHGHTLDTAIMERVIWARTISESQYQQAKQQQQRFKLYLDAAFKQLDGLWILPTTPSGAPKLTLSGEPLALYRSQLMGLTSIAGLSGFPQLHLPMQGLAEGPCGFSVMAAENSEAELIATGLCLSQGEKK